MFFHVVAPTQTASTAPAPAHPHPKSENTDSLSFFVSPTAPQTPTSNPRNYQIRLLPHAVRVGGPLRNHPSPRSATPRRSTKKSLAKSRESKSATAETKPNSKTAATHRPASQISDES